ncbi:GIY-YIG nuclease family protein [Deinococcus cellulosilyticus]|uniref:GIY-YIG nuclease family protein n=1 Tax=Deinococcus cellulosilyticus (strain DSM 18568 / NBRC 106333 / KACC 11606 / 5516J-15) TaxID=1223518 RepID=A0A511NBJ6_DEIC1|nr:GIY-YIG nuclease family protein [Deinococcus cellulosilyticus]GEM49936.1 hypothetical protein DC3_55710 [Deinococcus cellulosilyticus NBRC 106333 = KACC 11606]
MTQKYKGFTPVMGIWIIRNHKNGKVLLGANEHVQGKLNAHQFQLKMGSHMVKALQQDWNAQSPEDFTFEVLDVLEPDPAKGEHYDYRDDLKDLEALWLEQLQPYEPVGYHRKRK